MSTATVYLPFLSLVATNLEIIDIEQSVSLVNNCGSSNSVDLSSLLQTFILLTDDFGHNVLWNVGKTVL